MNTEIMNDIEGMKKLDKSNVMKTLESFPEQCEEAIRIGKEFAKKIRIKKPKGICICGMGASGISGDLLANLFSDQDIRVFKDYDLPKYINEDYLIFISTYSGGTEETLSMLKQAIKRKSDVIVISSSKDLKRELRKDIPFIEIPKGFPPRFAFAYLFFPLLIILKKIKFLEIKEDFRKVVNHLKETREEIKPSVPLKQNIAKRIAFKLKNTIPIIQGFGEYNGIAYRAKTQFNENSKVPSFSEFYPELNHNSILGWEESNHLTKRFSVILIRDENEGEKIRKRIEFTKKILRESVDNITELWSFYPLRLSRILSIMYILDFVSIYLGFIYRKDPGEYSLLLKLKDILKR
jgi:glucose/mannose-6-phosphate isomerase